MAQPQAKNASLLLLLITMCLWVGCRSSEMKDFSLDTIEAQSEARLKFLVDTSVTLPEITQYTSVRQQLDSLIYYAEWIKHYEEDIAFFYAQKAYDIATEKNLSFPRGVSAYQIGALKGRRALYGEDIEDALVDARISQRLIGDYNRSDWNMHIYLLMGFLLERQPDSDTARYYFNQALNQLEKLSLDSSIIYKNKALILHNLANSFSTQDSLLESNLYFQSDSLYQLINDIDDRKDLWLDWAVFYEYHHHFNKADSLYHLCLNIGQQKKDNDFLAATYQAMGDLYSTQFLATKNQLYLKKSIDALKKCISYESEKDFKYITYGTLGSIFQNSWAFDIDESHFDSAIHYYKLSIIKARKEGARRNLTWVSNNLSTLCEYETINCEKILGEKIVHFLNNNYMGLLDTLTKHSKAAFLRINKVEQRDIRINAANKRKNQFYIGIGIVGILGVIFLLLLQQQQNRRLTAEMEALRAQINPHFISNSLNAIESLVNLGNAKAAAKYLVHFSRLSRQILNGSRTATTSLAEELKTLSHFLALEQLRFRDKLNYEVVIDEAINQELVLIPAMILQPYVENAIWHGIKPKQTGGKISVKIHKIGKKLRCIIEDNGIGRTASDKLKKASILQHKSMGMKITEERLKGMGRIKGARIVIEDLTDELGNASGTRVILQLPYKFRK